MAESRELLDPDFSHLPDRQYTKQELVDQLNHEVKSRGRECEVGIFGQGHADQEAKGS